MSKTDPTATIGRTLSGRRSRITNEPTPLTPDDVADTVAALADTYARETSAAGVVVVDGMGLRLSVNRGALVIEDGIGEHRRTRRFDRATHGLRRLVVIGITGSVTFDALTWCRRLGIGVTVLAPDGTAVLASTPRLTDDARLRRQQAVAVGEPVGLDLARWLLGRKLTGQAGLLASRFDNHETGCTIADLASAVDGAADIEEARGLEAAAASLYWQSWVGQSGCAPVFAAKDRRRVPSHWARFEGRRSVLASANGNRKAERPVNALLNYTYALLEAEAILACQVVGLDPGLGIVHADTRSRQSLALDLMEPVRPEVDAFVLDLVERRTFRKAEFTETADGHCRLRAPLTHDLAETMPTWARAVAPIAEHVAHVLGLAMAGKYSPATPLTGRRTRGAQAAVKARKAAVQRAATSTTIRQRPVASTDAPAWTCPDCGGPVTNHRHVRCDTCIGADPRQTPELRGRRGAAIASRKRALKEWDEAHPGVSYDPDYFSRHLLPKLGTVKLAEIMAAAGCSKSYASEIRNGTYTPHVSTWAALGALAGASLRA
jgi:CRISPR-associated endonuclease Cas1